MRKTISLLKGSLILSLIVNLIILFQIKAFADESFATGYDHSAFIYNGDSLWMWGSKTYGQLGIKPSSIMSSERGNLRLILEDVKYVSLGKYFSAIIKKDDSLWLTGRNNFGQLGDGTTINQSNFIKIMDDVSSVSLGQDFVLTVKKDGSLWSWGRNHYGQLCNGTTNDSLSPIKIMESVRSASAGSYHTAIIKQDGTLLMCGRNSLGRLGLGKISTKEVNPQEVYFLDTAGNKIPVKQVSLGGFSTFFLLEDGTLWFSGSDSFGDACLGDGFSLSRTPIKVTDNVSFVRKGYDATAFVTGDNVLYMCGKNSYGELGLGHLSFESTPKKVMENVADIQLGHHYSIASTLDGSLYAWGENNGGQCGLGFVSIDPITSPTAINLPPYLIDVPEGKILKYNRYTKVGVEPGTGYTITDNTGIDVGIYKAILKLIPGYIWSDGTTEDKEVEWEIIKALSPSHIIDIPEGKTLEFNKRIQKGVEKRAAYTITGNTATEVGKYKAILKLNKNYEWSDGTTEDKVVEWEITQNPDYIVEIPEGQVLEYDGHTQTGIEKTNSYNISGNKGKNVRKYKATLTLKKYYQWSDGTTEDKEVEWEIIKAFNVKIPEGKTLTYNGRQQIGVEKSKVYKIQGNKGKNVGKYKTTLILNKNYGWADGTTNNKIVEWEIVKGVNPFDVTAKQVKVGFKKLLKSNVTLSKERIFITKKANGKVIYKKLSGNNTITVDKNGKFKIQQGLKKGKYNIKVNVICKGNKLYNPVTKTVIVKIVVK